jgi:ankyrin repeat protein
MLVHHLIRMSAACLVFVVSSLACAADLYLPHEDRASAWFAPKPITNVRPMCAAALEAERDTFFNPFDGNPKISGLTELPTENAVIEDSSVVVLDDYPLHLDLQLRDGSHAFIRFFGFSGCGGACETGSVGIDDEPILEGRVDRSETTFEWPSGLMRTDRYGPNRWRLFESADGDFYMRGTQDDHTQWYRIASTTGFELVCDIALKPDTSGSQLAVYPPEVPGAIESLRIAAERMAGTGGDCGSMHTPSRWAESRKQGLEAALYRPWAVVERHEYESENSGGDYSRIIEQLRLWSLGGVTEHRSFIAYLTQFDRTAAFVGQFYRTKFNWTTDRAKEMADAALKGAISSGFGFYMYDPYPGPGEQQLRWAILSRASMEEIRGFYFDAKAIDREGADSVLNVAIEYPEALSYLLEKGFDPNIGNAFGKTPLMYAAQYNQVAAAEILLKAGADPNAATHEAVDRCEYAIGTTNLTPLHYATRYSSAPLIKLLLDHGAVTFIPSAGEHSGEYPRDRLQKYAGIAVMDERNPNIAEAEVAHLAHMLALPSDAQKLALATDLVARSRFEYARGDAQRSYQHLRLALIAHPDQHGAIADLPLLALRAGYIGAAISAADRAINTLTSPAALAAAWFNKGLICEHPQARQISTVDDAQCEPDTLEPFVRSWKLQPSPARGNKLRALIQQSAGTCAAADPTRHYRLALKDYYKSFRIYVLHRPDATIDVSQIRWPHESQYQWKEPDVAGATVVETFRLGCDAVTLLEVPVSGVGGPPQNIRVLIEGQECARQL